MQRSKLRLILLVVACCAPVMASAGPEPIVDIPTSDKNVAIGGEYKSTKNVVEQEKMSCWNWAADIGYISQYNFRGTNLTPGSDGAGFVAAEVSRWNFTLGVYGIHQFGTARANSFAMGEGGGGGTSVTGFIIEPNPFFPGLGPPFFFASGTVTPETIQDRFNEIDIFLRYNLTIGPVDITVGNIGFFIDRRATTSVTFSNIFVSAPPFFSGSFPNFTVTGLGTVENEQFDRVFIRLATSKIPHIQPSITYYQTVYSAGEDKFRFPTAAQVQTLVSPPFNVPISAIPSFRGGERNNDLGGYLEGRLRGNFHLAEWIDFNPYGIISYSIRDRSEPVANPTTVSELLRGRSLEGFNHAQVGVELPIRVFHNVRYSSGPCAVPDLNLYFVPFGAYSYRIADPTPGTDRSEAWGGAKVTATF